MVATDHCALLPHEQKRFGVGDFTKIPNGTGRFWGKPHAMLMSEHSPLWASPTGRAGPNESRVREPQTTPSPIDLDTAYRRRRSFLVVADATSGVVAQIKTSHRPLCASASSWLIDYKRFLKAKELKGLRGFTLTAWPCGPTPCDDGETLRTPGKVHGKFLGTANPVTCRTTVDCSAVHLYPVRQELILACGNVERSSCNLRQRGCVAASTLLEAQGTKGSAYRLRELNGERNARPRNSSNLMLRQ